MKHKRQKQYYTSAASDDDDGSAVVVLDRISHLQDDLLLHVLSFLQDARNLARTSAVARRWRHLWTRAPVLSLRFRDTIGVLKLPSTVAFHELTDLSLSRISFLQDGDGDRRLSCLLSSPSRCFPRLQKLRLSSSSVTPLEFLELDTLRRLVRLDVDAAVLSGLAVRGLIMRMGSGYLGGSINAPTLKELWCTMDLGHHRRHAELHYYGQVLQRCTSVDRHTVGFDVPDKVDVEVVIDNVKRRLPHVKDLTLFLSSGHTHNFVAAAARFLAQCRHLQRLHLHIPHPSFLVNRCEAGEEEEECCGCDLPERWLQDDDDDTTLSLEHLRDAEMSGGFYGRDSHDMAQLLLTAAPVTCQEGSPATTCTGDQYYDWIRD